MTLQSISRQHGFSVVSRVMLEPIDNSPCQIQFGSEAGKVQDAFNSVSRIFEFGYDYDHWLKFEVLTITGIKSVELKKLLTSRHLLDMNGNFKEAATFQVEFAFGYDPTEIDWDMIKDYRRLKYDEVRLVDIPVSLGLAGTFLGNDPRYAVKGVLDRKEKVFGWIKHHVPNIEIKLRDWIYSPTGERFLDAADKI
jgi:hypothetical protein